MAEETTSTATDSPTESQESSTALTPTPVEETNWMGGMSDEFRSDPLVSQITSLDNLAKGYINAQRMVGADKVVVPGKHASDDELNQFYSKIGRPESADKYDLEFGDQKIDDDFVGEFKNWAHAAGLTTSQANKLAQSYAAYANTQMGNATQVQNTQREEGMNQLKADWGEQYDGRLQMAQVAVQELAKDDKALTALFNDPTIGDNPSVIRLMSKVGELFRDDVVRRGNTDGGISGFHQVTQQEALNEIEKYTNDLTGPYYDGNHPNHKMVVNKVLQLRKVANAGGQSVGGF